MRKSHDIVIFGATGFTGRLVAEYLHRTYGAQGEITWAMAGRSLTKLQRIRDELGIGKELPLLVADASDVVALKALVAQTRVVISTAGPYQLVGDALVLACAEAGTDYVDLCGEPGWMAQKIPQLQPLAAASGARIVFSCGFDSIPFDLGVLFLQNEALKTYGEPLKRVHGRVKMIKGGPSGGTAASLLATMEAAGRDRSLIKTLTNPYALVPGFKGPRQPNDSVAAWDKLAQSWTAPFVMAPINTKNVHRTHALLGHPWGTDFVYSERMLTGKGEKGERRAKKTERHTRLQNFLLAMGPTRAFIRRFVLPKPGEGPSPEQRENGKYELLFIGRTAGGQTLSAIVNGDRDPGYGSTCKLITESAMCLVNETGREQTPGGVWTPGAAMGKALQSRLQTRAGLMFSVLPA